ncbi:ATP-binding protein [Variovorax sp. HJSM1_2]|uniref:ATP-binding protein n=1 Tax=Variovorax sp. HJSM1_2 TaxID=3366263 RepID=UPI003BBC1C86
MNQAELLLRFGPFELYPSRKLLLERDKPVRLGSRAFALLVALVTRSDEVLSHEELISIVWPTTIVEEANLRVHMSALRKALGDGQTDTRYIINEPGHGYRFVARVERDEVEESGALEGTWLHSAVHNLPSRLTRMLGRAGATADVIARLKDQRLLTIVGAGGMGKTTVALAIAEEVAESFYDGVRLIDLSPVQDGELLPTTAWSAFDVGTLPFSEDPMKGLVNGLAEKRMLLVLDNCEHMVEAAVHFVETILKSAPAVHILATSREPLRAEGEFVYQLAALALPAEDLQNDFCQVQHSPAVQLFVERAMANADSFSLTRHNMQTVVQVCRQLDGIPLAIELAASQVDSLGLSALANRIDDRFRLLTRGRRSALPRHRTLLALLDWSYELLTATERIVFRRLAVFCSSFSLESAIRIAAFHQIRPNDVIDSVLSLVSKSLIATDTSGEHIFYRYLFSTRSYATAKAQEFSEDSVVAGRHAAHFLDSVLELVASTTIAPFAVRVCALRRMSDDIRAAISWAASTTDSAAVGVRLAVAAIDASQRTGFSFDEYGRYLDQVLQQLERSDHPEPELELYGLSALCAASGQTTSVRRSYSDLVARTLQLSALPGPTDERIAALFGATVASFGAGRYQDAQRLLERLGQITVGEWHPVSVAVVDRLSVLVSHYLGEHDRAQELSKRVLAANFEGIQRRFIPEIPLQVSMRIVRARILWLRGYADQAESEAEEAIQHAYIGGVEHALAACQALGLAVLPIALWRGDTGRVTDYVAKLKEISTRVSLSYWMSWAQSYEAVLMWGNRDEQHSALRWEPPENAKELDHLGTFVEDFVTARTVSRATAGEALWCAPEILRVHGVRLLRKDDAEANAEGEALLQSALKLASDQHAPAWELRIATSLADLWHKQGFSDDARALLTSTLERCAEGAETKDPLRAKAILQKIAQDEHGANPSVGKKTKPALHARARITL